MAATTPKHLSLPTMFTTSSTDEDLLIALGGLATLPFGQYKQKLKEKLIREALNVRNSQKTLNGLDKKKPPSKSPRPTPEQRKNKAFQLINNSTNPEKNTLKRDISAPPPKPSRPSNIRISSDAEKKPSVNTNVPPSKPPRPPNTSENEATKKNISKNQLPSKSPRPPKTSASKSAATQSSLAAKPDVARPCSAAPARAPTSTSPSTTHQETVLVRRRGVGMPRGAHQSPSGLKCPTYTRSNTHSSQTETQGNGGGGVGDSMQASALLIQSLPHSEPVVPHSSIPLTEAFEDSRTKASSNTVPIQKGKEATEANNAAIFKKTSISTVYMPMHPRELSRNMDYFLKLPKQIKQDLKAESSHGTEVGTVVDDEELPLQMRNQRYQIHFLESLQELKRGAIVKVNGQVLRMKLHDKGSSIVFENIAIHTSLSTGSNRNQSSQKKEQQVHCHSSSIDLSKGFTVRGDLSMRNNDDVDKTADIPRMCIIPNHSNTPYDYSLDPSSIHTTKSSEQALGVENSEDPPFWIEFHHHHHHPEEGDIDNSSRTQPRPGFKPRHEEALVWMSTLSSIAFSKWWNYKTKLETDVKTSKKKESSSASSSSLRDLIHYHLWQASRVALYELMYHQYHLSDIVTTESQDSQERRKVVRAWRYIEACLDKINEGSSTNWVLPLNVKT